MLAALSTENAMNLLSSGASVAFASTLLAHYPASKVSAERAQHYSPWMFAVWRRLITQPLAEWDAAPLGLLQSTAVAKQLAALSVDDNPAHAILRRLGMDYVLVLLWATTFACVNETPRDESERRDCALRATLLETSAKLLAAVDAQPSNTPNPVCRETLVQHVLCPLWSGSFHPLVAIDRKIPGDVPNLLPLDVAASVASQCHRSDDEFLRLLKTAMRGSLKYDDTVLLLSLLNVSEWGPGDEAHLPSRALGAILATEPAGSLKMLPPAVHKKLLGLDVSVSTARDLPNHDIITVMRNMERALQATSAVDDIKLGGEVGLELRTQHAKLHQSNNMRRRQENVPRQ